MGVKSAARPTPRPARLFALTTMQAADVSGSLSNRVAVLRTRTLQGPFMIVATDADWAAMLHYRLSNSTCARLTAADGVGPAD